MKSAGKHLLLLCATGLLVGMNCQVGLCPDEGQRLNPLTGLCEPDDADTSDDGDGVVVAGGPTFPPGPGTGGLPTEEDVNTSTADDSNPDAVDLLTYGLNGRWRATDNGRISCILHTGSMFLSTLIEERLCEHFDGTGAVSMTFEDLEGMVVGETITGTTKACREGNEDTSLNGIFDFDMTLTISEDGKTLAGFWDFDGEIREFSLVRETVGNCMGGL